ncbi:MAG: histone deacetylase, partial [Burkholderiaceae bacterium]|nr:histone deacetylase [Burkholderiaceae bacterium]
MSAAHRVKAFSTDLFVLPLPPNHRFPMEKYRLLRQHLEGNERIALCEPAAATDGELALAHAPAYVEQIVSGSLSEQAIAAIGFPWSEAMV